MATKTWTMKLLERTARFDSVCPQCKRPLKTGTTIHAAVEIAADGKQWGPTVWRCPECSAVFMDLGPTPRDTRTGRSIPWISLDDMKADRARREAVIAKHDVTKLWNREPLVPFHG